MVWEVVLQLLLWLTAASAAASQALPGCPEKCGDVSIPYPFGIGDGCSRPGFNITCNHTVSPNKPTLNTSNIELLEIQLSMGFVRINPFLAYRCYNKSGYTKGVDSFIRLGNLPYKFSDTRNQFVSIGCDTAGFLLDGEGRFTTGCTSICNSMAYVVNGTCSGIGCCETPIPKGLMSFKVSLGSYRNHSNCWEFNPCSFSFLADRDWFTFSASNFSDLMNVNHIPVTLDWAIGNKTCEEASKNLTSYACVAEQSCCYNSTNGPGYICNCSEGYEGNPFLKGGCVDIDECAAADNPCARKCTNKPGNYSCSCPGGTYGDGRKVGSGCRSIFPLLQVVLGSGLSILFVIITSSWLYWVFKRKRLIELKEKFFRQNGGFLLQQKISSLESSSQGMRLFTTGELEKATNNYDEGRVLGQGGFGTVYKGILSDETVVAIKKSKITEETEIAEFINEVIVLTHTNHRNVVTLLGCCLETRVPLLVYEYVSNGTLSRHIHQGSLSLESRLRIAAETAGALAYLHSSASIPIVHRDVKSTNILLDDNCTAKVSDFGASRLVPFDQNRLTSLVRGTFGYLDPEYFHTAQFTDKSDVYSFGVVLVELLTGEKPVSMDKAPENRNLATHFISCMKEKCLPEILEPRVIDEGSMGLIQAVAELAKRCLRLHGEERPSMKEVAMELEGLRRLENHPWINDEEEVELLLDEPLFSNISGTFRGEGSGSHVMQMQPFDIMR